MDRIGKLKRRHASEIRNSGISIGFECLDRRVFRPEKCYDKLAEAGVKWARCQTGWCRCETEKGKFDFQWLDEIVDNLLIRGVQPWFNLGFGNRLYMPGAFGEAAVGSVPLYFGSECLEAWKRYVSVLAEHFASRVKRWEIWNEPENDCFWQPEKANPLEYARLIRLTAPLIRERIADAEIGSCSCAVYLNDYTPEFIASGIAEELDFHSVHRYRIQPEFNYAAELGVLQRLFSAYGGRHVRIFQGESGYASWFPDGHWLHPYILHSERNQAKWLLRSFLTDFRLGVEFSSFFQMADMMEKEYQMGNLTRKNPARHGILNGLAYTPKLSWEAISHLTALFDQETVRQELRLSLDSGIPRERPRSRLADVAFLSAGFLRRGLPFHVYYVPEDIQMEWDGLEGVSLWTAPCETEHRISDPVLIDLLDGFACRVTEYERDHRGDVCCCRNLPLRDYPLVLTDFKAVKEDLEF